MCASEPDVPVIDSEYVPGLKLVPLIVRVAVAGKAFTDVGLTLQLPDPYVVGQLRATMPPKPSCEAIEIGPLVPVLPALISGKAEGSVRTKSVLAVTFSVKDVLTGDGAPVVVA